MNSFRPFASPLARGRHAAPALLLACLLSSTPPAVAAEPALAPAQVAALKVASQQLDTALSSVGDVDVSKGFDAQPESVKARALDAAEKLLATAASNSEKALLFRRLSHSSRIKFAEGRKGDELFQTFWTQFAQQLDRRIASRSSPGSR